MQALHHNGRFARMGEKEMVYMATGFPLPIFLLDEAVLQREGDLYSNGEKDASSYAFKDSETKQMTFLEKAPTALSSDGSDGSTSNEGGASNNQISATLPVPATMIEAKHVTSLPGKRNDRSSLADQQNVSALQKDFDALLADGIDSDAQIIIRLASGANVTQKAHSCILSARSSVMKELLHSEEDTEETPASTTKEIDLTEHTEIVANEFIRYLYTGRMSLGSLELRCPLSSGSIEYLLTMSSLINIAEAFEVFALSACCEQVLKQSMYGANLAEVLHIARSHEATGLQNVVLSLIESQIKESMKAEVDAQKKRVTLMELLDANGLSTSASKFLSRENSFLTDDNTTLEDSNESADVDRSIRKSLFKDSLGPPSDLNSRRRMSSSAEELSGYEEVSKSIRHSSDFRDLEEKLVDLVRAHPEGIMGCQVKPKFKERYNRPLLLPQGISLKQVFLGIRNKGIHIELTGFNKLPKYYFRHGSMSQFGESQMGPGGRAYSPVDALMAADAASPEGSAYCRTSASKSDYTSSSAKSTTPNVCRFFQANRWCRYGNECRLLHDGRLGGPPQGVPVGPLRLGRAGDDSATPSNRTTPISSGPSPSSAITEVGFFRDRPYTPNFVPSATPQNRRSPTIQMMQQQGQMPQGQVQQSPVNLLTQSQHNTHSVHKSSHYSMDSLEDMTAGQPQSSLWAPSSMGKPDRTSPAVIFNNGNSNPNGEDVGLSLEGPGSGMIKSIFADVVENNFAGSGNVGIGYGSRDMNNSGYDNNYLSSILGPSSALSPSKPPYQPQMGMDANGQIMMSEHMQRVLNEETQGQQQPSFGSMSYQSSSDGTNPPLGSANNLLSTQSSLDFSEQQRAYSHSSSLDKLTGANNTAGNVNGSFPANGSGAMPPSMHSAGNVW